MIDWGVFWGFLLAMVVFHHGGKVLRALGFLVTLPALFFRALVERRERVKAGREIKEPWQ